MVESTIFVACTAWLLVLLLCLASFLACAKWCLGRVLEFDIALAVGMLSGAIASIIFVVLAAKEKVTAPSLSDRIPDMMLVSDIFYLSALFASKVTIVLALRRIFSLHFSTFILPALLASSISLVLGLAAVSLQCYPFLSVPPTRWCGANRDIWVRLWTVSATCDVVFEIGFTSFTIFISRKASSKHRTIIRTSFCCRIINIAPTIARTVLLAISSPISPISVIVVTQLCIDVSLFSCLGTARHLLIEPFGAMMRKSITPTPSLPLSQTLPISRALLLKLSLRSGGSGLSMPLSINASVREIPKAVLPAGLQSSGQWGGDGSFMDISPC